MRLRETDDGHSVFVLYSDLLFNLVIIFLIVVLALVLRLNLTMRRVAATPPVALPTPATQALVTPEQLKKLTFERDTARTTANLLAGQLATARQQVSELSGRQQSEADAKLKAFGHRLSIAAGANRFTGRTGNTSLCVGIDYSKRPAQYVLMSASAFNAAHSTLDGESAAEHLLRSARLLTTACRGARRYSADELEPLFRAIQTRSSNGVGREEGCLSFSFSTRASAAASGWLSADGELDSTDALRDLARQHGRDDLSELQTAMINALIALRDRLRPSQPPETVPVLHFSEAPDRQFVVLGGKLTPLPDFRNIVDAFGDAGMVLQFDSPAGTACPDWVIRDVLTPVGYTNSVPDPAELSRLTKAMTAPQPSRP